MRTALVLCLLAVPSVALSQELPKVTEEGQKAAVALLTAFVKEGGLKAETDPKTKRRVVVVGDGKKLRALVKQRRGDFTPAVRDALLRFSQHPGIVALLLAAGEETGDAQALAFGRLFAADLAEQHLRYREARQDYERASKLFGGLKMAAWQALSLNNLALVCRAQGNLPRARKLSEQALELFKQLHGERHPHVAQSLNNLALVCKAQGDLPQARKLNQQALDLRQQILPAGHPDVALSLNNLAAVCLAQGDLPQARKLFQQSLELRKQLHGERHPDVANSLNNLAAVCKAQGDLPQARKLCQQALDLYKQLHGARHPHVATSLNNLAVVCQAQGDLPQARKLSEQALELNRQLHGERHPDVATSLSTLAAVCQAQGDLPQARKLCQQALDLYKQLHGERHPDVAQSLNNLATVCQDQGDLPQARKLCRQALELRRRIHGQRHPAVATSLNNLATVCQDQGDLPQARKLFQQSLELYKQLHGERHPDVANSLNNLAAVCKAQGDKEEALRYLRQAALACRLPLVKSDRLAGLRADDLRCDPLILDIVGGLGEAIHSLNRGEGGLREAAHAYALAAAVLDRFRSDDRTSEGGKLDQGSRLAALVPDRVGLAAALFKHSGKAEDLHIAFTAIEQGRGRVFLEAIARARSHQLGGVPDTLRAEEFDLRSHLRGLDAAIKKENAKTLDQRNADNVKDLYGQREQEQKRLDAFAARLRQKYPQYAALQYPRPCTLDEARASLGANEVAVLFALDKKESYAVVVHKRPADGDRGQGVVVVKLPGSDVLEPKVRALVDENVLKSDSRCRQLGAKLYALLLKPLQKHIAGKDLVLSPDGLLWELPFELLVDGHAGEAGKYLIETRQMRYTPSLTVLHLTDQWQKTRKAPAEPLWALGDPVFSKEDKRARGGLHRETEGLLARYGQRQRGGLAWERLPATGAEVRALADLFKVGKDDVVTDIRASEAVLKAASVSGVLARKRYIHLATHGWLGSAIGQPPSLVLSLVGIDHQEQLGGVNDGYLTMQEVTHLKLNADLVVLSACETGKGELIASEGVVGLSRAFLYAGSRGVVCSLWQVDDERTAELMKVLYTELKGGKVSATEALALARRKLIAQEQAPFYWAPFILIGNGE